MFDPYSAFVLNMYVQVFLQSILVRNVSSRVYSPVDCKLHCKKTKLCGHSLAQNQLACALLVTGLSHLLWLFSPPHQRKLLPQVRKG